ncbi:MAG: hypothetical protein QOC77_3515 [Thermoleophilaceae bacterium]|jgi:hypothetical protein|nr:hypothetical protein [Thermoleophilaceae bacterium]
MRMLAALVAVASMLAVCACGGGSKGSGSAASGSAASTSYTAQVAGGRAFIAIVAGKANVVAYVCNGGHGIAEPFAGPRRGTRVDLKSARGAHLSASIGAASASGTITLTSGRVLRFTAARSGGRSGLYRVKDERRVKASWVVLPDGRQRGTFAGSTVNPSASTAQIRSVGTVVVVHIDSRAVAGASFSGFNGFNGFGG